MATQIGPQSLQQDGNAVIDRQWCRLGQLDAGRSVAQRQPNQPAARRLVTDCLRHSTDQHHPALPVGAPPCGGHKWHAGPQAYQLSGQGAAPSVA